MTVLIQTKETYLPYLFTQAALASLSQLKQLPMISLHLRESLHQLLLHLLTVTWLHLQKEQDAKWNVKRLQMQHQSDVATEPERTLQGHLGQAMGSWAEKRVLHHASLSKSTAWLFTRVPSVMRYAYVLRYNRQPLYLPTNCVWSQAFSLDHALSCPTGGFPTIRHNERSDFTASVLSEVCHDVSIEPQL